MWMLFFECRIRCTNIAAVHAVGIAYVSKGQHNYVFLLKYYMYFEISAILVRITKNNRILPPYYEFHGTYIVRIGILQRKILLIYYTYLIL